MSQSWLVSVSVLLTKACKAGLVETEARVAHEREGGGAREDGEDTEVTGLIEDLRGEALGDLIFR